MVLQRLPWLSRNWRGMLLRAGTCAIIGLAVLAFLFAPIKTPVMRGQALARKLGCFTCHGPNGSGGVVNPGAVLGIIPPFGGSTFKSYVHNEEETREWILYGAPRRLWIDGEKPSEQLGRAKGQDGLIFMPAYEDLLSDSDLEDLVAYVKARSSYERPISAQAAEGMRVCSRMGCFGCHSDGGRGGPANPKSFKGYIPPWDGEDFAEIVENEEELREWILDGTTIRFSENLLATYFLRTQVIKMPAYRGLLTKGEVDDIVAYVHWLRDDEKTIRNDWVEPPARSFASQVKRGEWLYRRLGCVRCHGKEGRGGVPNPNAKGGTVPGLDYTAERLELFEKKDADKIIAAIERGVELQTLADRPPVERYDVILRRFQALRNVITLGSHPTKGAKEGPHAAMQMPSWSERLFADGGPASMTDVDAIIAYLVSLQPWDDEEDEETTVADEPPK